MNQEDRWRDNVERELRDLRKDVSELKGGQRWAIGAAGALLWVVGFFSEKIEHLLGK